MENIKKFPDFLDETAELVSEPVLADLERARKLEDEFRRHIVAAAWNVIG